MAGGLPRGLLVVTIGDMGGDTGGDLGPSECAGCEMRTLFLMTSIMSKLAELLMLEKAFVLPEVKAIKFCWSWILFLMVCPFSTSPNVRIDYLDLPPLLIVI